MGTLDRDAYMRHRFSGSQRFVHTGELRIVRGFLRRLEGVRRVLDAPCGHGRFAALLTEAAEAPPVSVDLDRRHLVALRRAEADPTWPVAQLRLGAPLPFRDDSFDLCFSFRFLQHLRDPSEQRVLLAELARVSARYVIVSYYQARSLHSMQKTLRHALKRKRKPKLSLISRQAFATLAEGAGLALVDDRALLPGLHAQRVALLEIRE